MKFKVGDIVRHYDYPRQYSIITEIEGDVNNAYWYKVIIGRLAYVNNCYVALEERLIKATNKKIINKVNKLMVFK